MKENYSVEIAGTRMYLISDENEEYVNTLVALLNKRINDLVMTNLRCTKYDATLLCALDYLDEKTKAQEKIKELENKLAAAEAEIEELKRNADLEKRSKSKK